MKLKMQQFRLVSELLKKLSEKTRICNTQLFIQHGSTTVYSHCRNVAVMSLKIAENLRIKIDKNSIVRGALLHDYFLYDWHDHNKPVKWHGYRHPAIALTNALEDCSLNSTEQDIILHHMWPLTLSPPKTREGFIVCIADKLCSLYETFRLNERHLLKRKKLLKV